MKARTLVGLVASYNSTRSRYIVTVTQPVLQRAAHGRHYRRLTRRFGDVIEHGAPGRLPVASLDASMGPGQRQSIERYSG